MRGKEEAHDYRYFPDPDLLPLVIDEEWIERTRRSLPELPDARCARFVQQHGLPSYDAGVLTADRELADYFEACLKLFPQAKPVSNWIMGPLLGLLNAAGVGIDRSPIPPSELAGLLQIVDEGAISAKIAKTVFDEMSASGKTARAIVQEKGLAQISDAGTIEKIVQEVLTANPKEVEAYRSGKTKLMGFFVGEVMKATRGQANPKAVNELLRKMLEE
jgi:aspartyl-tRNA(Asn)/glutamyl-tRNA(Gln) amidotransferase subunit B